MRRIDQHKVVAAIECISLPVLSRQVRKWAMLGRDRIEISKSPA